MRLRLVFVLLLCAMLISTCAKHLKPDFLPTEKEFSEKVKSFPFKATNERKQQVLENYSKLELGMTKDQVAATIGEPDYWGVTGPGKDNVTGSSWVYGFYCTGRFCGTTSDDDLLEVLFDLDDRVDWIAPSPRLNLEPKRKPRP